MLGLRMAIAAQMGEGDSDAVLLRVSMPPNLVVPLHTHADPESFLVLGGAMAIWLDGRWRELREGENLLVPGDAPHALRTSGDVPVDVLVMTYGRLLRFFREAGRTVMGDAPPASPTPTDIGRVIEAAQRFGYWLAPPEEHMRVTG